MGRKQSIGIEHAAVLGAVASLVTIAGSLARSKVTAEVLGPEGVGLSAQVLQVSNLAFLPLGMLTGPALLRRLAPSAAEGHDGALSADTAATACWTVSAATALYVLVAAVAASAVLPDRTGHDGLRLLLVLAVVTAGLAKLSEVFRQAFVAHAALRTLTMATAVATVVFSVGAVVGTLLDDLRGQYAAVAIATMVGVAIHVVFARRAGVPIGRWVRFAWDGALFREAATVGLASLFAGMALQVALITIRTGMGRSFGDAAVGQFQAAWVVGVQYFGLLLNGVRQHAFPRYASASGPAELEQELRDAARFVLRWAPPALLLCIALRDWIIRALYSDKFSVAAEILGYQLAGDMVKSLSWTVGAAMIYRAELRGFAITQAFGAVALPVLVLSATSIWGPTGAGMGYAAAYLLQLLVVTSILRLRMGVRVGARAVVTAIVWMVVALAANEMVSRVPVLRYPLALAAGAVVLPRLLEGRRGRRVVVTLRGMLERLRGRR